uniref:Uncharacterized protein n=1 Tax=Aliivibrio fischeri TaxID=668 RepID=H2ERQ2_ALIFS|nr:hypothetical protein [Aliivibrio fischeri]AEY78069.1 hypothetical protein [Aliivibrio fischeri]
MYNFSEVEETLLSVIQNQHRIIDIIKISNNLSRFASNRAYWVEELQKANKRHEELNERYKALIAKGNEL